MKVIGLTGPSGSGKSIICAMLESKGYPFIDTDSVYHNLISYKSECAVELANNFDTNIFFDGIVDRAKLAEVVFSSNDKLNLLNKITHKYVLFEVNKTIDKYRMLGYNAVIVDAPALFESGFDKECDSVISVIAPIQTRIERIIKRDGISFNKAKARIDAQHKHMFYITHSNFTLCNNSDASELLPILESILKIEGIEK